MTQSRRRAAQRRGTPGWLFLVAEVQVVAARRGPSLTLVLRARAIAAVGNFGGRGHLQERDLPDLHLGIQRDREVRHVRQLQREVTVEAAVDEAGRGVDEQAEPPEAALALEPADKVVA